MAVSRDEVIYAYRLILGREPESEAVIDLMMTAESRVHLRQAFLGSPEFLRNHAPQTAHVLPVGRYFQSDRVDVDLSSTPEQLQAMFDRIGESWKEFGKTEPHWSVLVSEDFRQENLAANIDRFYESGHGDIAVSLNFLRRAELPLHFGKALDFGCGVGRLTLALSDVAAEVVGIDISPPHLELAQERAKEKEIANVRFDSIASVADLDRYDGFDLIISRIVLQHNPPPVMAEIYRKLLAALAPGGVAVIQMPTFIEGQAFAVETYLTTEQPSMEMNALPQKQIFEIIEAAGCRAIEVREDGAGGDIGLSHTFAVQRVA